MKKSNEVIVKDKRVIAYYKEIQEAIDGGNDATLRAAWPEALAAYQQALDSVRKAIAYCEKAPKKTYIAGLKGFIGTLNSYCGRCLAKMGKIDQSVECYQRASTDGVKDAHDQIFAVLHNSKNFDRAYPYLLQQDKYKTLPLKTLVNYAIRLSDGNMETRKDLKIALLILLYIVKCESEGNTELEGVTAKGFVEEKIAEIYGELKDIPRELEWRLKAVSKDYPAALHNYGEMLNDGEGVKRNEEEALKYHLRAAELGQFDAMIACAIHFLKSDVIPVDIEKAEYWLNHALPLDAECSAAVEYCGLILEHYRDNTEKMHKLNELIPIVEKFDPDEAKNARALLLIYGSPKVEDEQLMQGADMLAELADKGLPSAQFNLAILYHMRPGFRRELAVPLYLEAIAQGNNLLARHNLYSLIIELAIGSTGDSESLLKFFRSIVQRYLKALPKDLQAEDVYLPEYIKLISALKEGVKGNVTEFLKALFPKVHHEINAEIISVSTSITRTAQTLSFSPADRIAAILELTLISESTNRARTCAFRRIGEIVASNLEGYQALMDNVDAFNQLTAEIVANPLDNEAYVELAVGLAKLKIHPSSCLVSHCYQKLHEYHGAELKCENLYLTPHQSCMLVSALSDMPISLASFSSTLLVAVLILQTRIPKMNAWQLLKSLQALCVIHAYHKINVNAAIRGNILDELLQNILSVNPRDLSMIDSHQLLLCLNYIDKKSIGQTKALRTKFQSQFLEMMNWLKYQKPRSSHLHERLAGYIRKYRKDVIVEKLLNGLYVDIFLHNINAVVEFDGVFHFMWQAPHENFPLLRVTRDYFHEAIIGLPVVRVDYLEFDSLNHFSRENIREFLQKKLAVLGISLTDPQAESGQKPDELVKAFSSACK